MNISSEHTEAVGVLNDALRSFIEAMKGMPTDMDISVKLTKEGCAIRIDDFRCSIVRPLVCYEDDIFGYIRNKNAVLKSRTKIEFLPDGTNRLFKVFNKSSKD